MTITGRRSVIECERKAESKSIKMDGRRASVKNLGLRSELFIPTDELATRRLSGGRGMSKLEVMEDLKREILNLESVSRTDLEFRRSVLELFEVGVGGIQEEREDSGQEISLVEDQKTEKCFK